MKYFFVLFFALSVSCLQSIAQKNGTSVKNNPPCDCEALGWHGKGYIPNGATAEKLIGEYIDKMKEHSGIRATMEQIFVREANCGSPMAVLCEDDVRLILFNDYFLSIINKNDKIPMTLVDKHVLAHELGHHVLGHFKTVGPLEKIEQIYRDEQGYLKKHFNLSGSNPMAQEIEADLFGLWLLSKYEKNFTAQDLIAQMDTMRLAEWDKRFLAGASGSSGKEPDSKKKSYGTHPFFKDRIAIMRKYQNVVGRFPKTIASRGFAQVANSAYIDLWPKRHYWDVAVSLGVAIAGAPMFKVDQQKTDAFLYAFNEQPSIHAGFSVSRFRWNKPWQSSLDMYWSKQQYGTTMPVDGGKRLVERLQFSYVSFCPQIGWNSAGAAGSRSLSSRRIGFFINVGLNLFLPFGKMSYENHVAEVAAPQLQFSAAPKISIGVSKLRKTYLPRGLKWLISYEPQWIRLNATPKPLAISHNLTTTLQYTILRY